MAAERNIGLVYREATKGVSREISLLSWGRDRKGRGIQYAAVRGIVRIGYVERDPWNYVGPGVIVAKYR
jgi:hypothetical protein